MKDHSGTAPSDGFDPFDRARIAKRFAQHGHGVVQPSALDLFGFAFGPEQLAQLIGVRAFIATLQ